MRVSFAKALLLISSCLLAFGVCEVLLGVFSHATPQLELDIFRMEDDVLLLRPNTERRHLTRYWDVSIRINSGGWRDGDDPGRGVEIVGLGDSFAFGWGVELEDSFYAILEKGLRGSRGPRILKAGVPGSSTLDQERLLARLLRRYRPRLVLTALFVGNDFTETGLGGAQRLRVTDGLLELKPLEGGPEPARTRFLRAAARNSRLLQLLRAVQFRFGIGTPPSRSWDAWMREFAQIHLRRPSPRAEAAIAATLASLDRIAAQCRASGASLALLILPRSFQVDPGERREMMAALDVGPDELDLDRPQRVLEAWSSESEVVVVNPISDFRHRSEAGERLFYTPDAHLTPAGHRVVAEAALRDLADLVAEPAEANLERR